MLSRRQALIQVLLFLLWAASCAGAAARGHARRLQQAPPASPPPDSLVSALGTISSDLSGLSPSRGATTQNGAGAPPAIENATASVLPADVPLARGAGSASGPAPCTDPSLLVTTMTTFCRLGSLAELAALSQDAVQACCRLTSATLQPNCWDACNLPPAVSTQVLDVLQLWRNICLVSADVTCQEGPGTPSPSG